MPNIEDLGRLIRKQNPGEFDDIKSDIELGRQIKQNTPGEYDDYADVNTASKPKAKNPAGSVLETANKVFSAVPSTLTKKVYAPVAGALTTGKTKEKLQAISGSKDIQMPSNVMDVIAPFMQSQPEDFSNEAPKGEKPKGALGNTAILLGAKSGAIGDVANKTARISRVLANLGIDIAADPQSYVGIGEMTDLGKLRSIVQEQNVLKAAGSGGAIPFASKVAKGIAKSEKAAAPTGNMIKNFRKTAQVGSTFAKRVTKGEQSIANLGPLQATGKLAGKAAEIGSIPFQAMQKNAMIQKMDGLVKSLFSNYSGNPEFDALYHRYRAGVLYKAGLEVDQTGKHFNTIMSDLSRDMGRPREDIANEMNRIIELSKPKPTATKIYGKQVGQAIGDFYHDKLVDARVDLVNATAKGNTAGIDDAAKRVANWNSQLNLHNNHYRPPGASNPAMDAFKRDIQLRLENQRLAEQASGRTAPVLMADISYLPRIITPETTESLRQHLIASGKLPKKFSSDEFNSTIANYMRRQMVQMKPEVIQAWESAGIISKKESKVLQGANGLDKMDALLKTNDITPEMFNDAVHSLTFDDVQALPRAEKERVFGKGVPDQPFHTDPTYYTTIRNIRGQKAMATSEFFQEMKNRNLALPNDHAPPSWVNVRQGELADHKVSPEIARVLNKRNSFDTDPQEFNKVLQYYDKFHALNKAWTLAIFPAYHTKNIVGNVWNNWLAGVTNPIVYKIASDIQRGRKVNFTDVLGKKWGSGELLEEAKRLGVVRGGQYIADPARSIEQRLQGGKWLTLGQRNKVLQLGKEVGGTIEDNARIAHFVGKMKDGMTPEQAALSVKKYLFDYGDMTPFERKALNRVFFFYKWTRENLPLQLHHLVTTPWKFGVPFKAKYDIEKEISVPDEKYLSQWMLDNFPNRIRKLPDGRYEYFMLNNWLPAADLLKVSQMHDIAAQSLAPIIKEPLQQFFNYDLYFKKQIDPLLKYVSKPSFAQKAMGIDKVDFMGGRYPSKLVHAAKAIRILNEVDKMTKKDSDIYSKMMGILAGKTYSVDFNQQMLQNTYQTGKDADGIKQAIMAAAKKGDWKQVDQLTTLLREKLQEY